MIPKERVLFVAFVVLSSSFNSSLRLGIDILFVLNVKNALLAFAYSEFFVYVTMVLVLLMAYGYCLTTCCITMDLLASSFQKAALREKMFMTSPLQSSIVILYGII